jgi:hypothetical protein
MPRHLEPPSSIGTTRFGRTSSSKRATGLAPHELQVVVAVLSCWVAEGAYPTRDAIASISEVDDTSMPARLVREGWLEVMGRVRGNAVAYGAAPRAWADLGFGRVDAGRESA